MSRMCELALAGDAEGAQKMDDALRSMHRDLFVEANPVPVKWALWQMGLIGRGIRLPLVELDEQFHVKVLDALLNAGIKVG
jgi:dihydrodipicolinate synthase/N-acetylneuraminate lyase